ERVAPGIDVPLAADRSQDARQGIDTPFPFGMKRRLAFFVHDRTHAVHAAHVVDAVHTRPPGFEIVTLLTPIIESRVTSAASCSSVIRSVPAGRSGSTRYRTSAVLSQTRTSTSSSSSSPNSRITPRGSITARERYGADLYQTGGKPRTGHG